MPSRVGDVEVVPGDIIRVERGGGGGLGDPRKRERKKVLADLREGYVTIASAKSDYGCEFSADELGGS